MTYVLIYLTIGLLNLLGAGFRHILMVGMPQHRKLPDAWVEIAFYLLLWPIQLLFWTIVHINNATGYLLSRIMGE